MSAVDLAPSGGRSPATVEWAGRILILSLVHPDCLPPLYAVSQVLRDHGYGVDLFSFSSPTEASLDVGPGVQLHDCGVHGGPAWHRHSARREFRRRTQAWCAVHEPTAVLAACPFSFLEALRIARGRAPVVYLAYEMYEVAARDLFVSPATAFRNLEARRHLDEAALICVPSPERAGWLAARARLGRLPTTVLNAPPTAARDAVTPSLDESTAATIPVDLLQRRLVIHTGGVSRTQAVEELVDSVAYWPPDAALLITNVGRNAHGQRLHAAVARSPRRSDVVLLPTVPRCTMLALQRRARVGVCLLRAGDVPETTMPAPNKVGEYLHAGLCVVGVRMPYLDRLEEHGVAVLADQLDPAAIGRAVSEALRRAQQPEFRSRVRGVVDAWYCMEVQARPILRLLARRQPQPFVHSVAPVG